MFKNIHTQPRSQRSRVSRFMPGVPQLAHTSQLGKINRENNNTTEAEWWIFMHGSRTRAKKLLYVQDNSMHSGSPVQGQCRFDVCDVSSVGEHGGALSVARNFSNKKEMVVQL